MWFQNFGLSFAQHNFHFWLDWFMQVHDELSQVAPLHGQGCSWVGQLLAGLGYVIRAHLIIKPDLD